MRLLAERSALREDTARLLDELGGTVGEVAISLYSMGVRTRDPWSHGDSPAARYLNAVVGADLRVSRITVTARWLGVRTRRGLGPRIWLRLPHPVRQFTVLVEQTRAREATAVSIENNQR